MRYTYIALLFVISYTVFAEEEIPEFNQNDINEIQSNEVNEIPSNIDDPLNVVEINSDPNVYGPTKRGDSLWNIALKVRPSDDITTQHMMLALYLSNRNAFVGGNLNSLKPNQTLRIPDAQEIAKVGRMNIAAEIQKHSNNPNSKAGIKRKLRKIQRQADAQTAKNEQLRRKLEQLEGQLQQLMSESENKDARIESIKAQLGQ